MAAALLGKCIGLLALVLLLCSCYAFRIRDHPGQTASLSSTEQPQRAACTSIFGRCQEKTITATSTSRKWHDTTASRLASTARKPPVELTSTDDDDGGSGEEHERRERTGRFVDSLARDKASGVSRSIEIDEDEDGEEAIVEVEEDSAEEIASDDLEAEDSDDAGEENAEDGDSEDDDDDVEKKEETNRDQKLKQKVVKDKDDEDDEEEEEEKEIKGKKGFHGKTSRIMKTVVKSTKKIAEDTEEEEKSERVDLKRKVSLEKGLKGTVKSQKQEKVVEDEEEEEEDKAKDDDVDKDEDEEEEEEEDEDEDEEKSEEVVPTPRSVRKLEKVRHADKERVRSTETIPFVEKSKIEVKEPSKIDKKPEEIARKIETMKKPVEKKPMEATKKIEPRTTKSDLEPSKSTSKPEEEAKIVAKPDERTKIPVKPDDKAKVSVKPEESKTRESAKQSETVRVKSTSARPAPAKVAEVKRSDKDEPKVKTKTHVDAAFTLARLNDAILRVPTFVPNFTAVENFECQQHGKIFLRQLRGYKLWALQMLDSSAKIPSGLLRGNVNQFGDFDECLGVMAHVKLNENTIKVQGKYCLAKIDLYPSHPNMKLPVNMMQARAFIRGNMHDPGHFIPKFTTVNWALCLPAVCSAEDAHSVLKQALDDYNSTTGITFMIDVDPNMCYVKQKSRIYSKETIGVLYFYAMILCLVAVATTRDYLVVSEGKGNYSERIIMSFSLRRSFRSLLKKGSREVDITCIHGIRALVTIALYIAHQVIAISRLPFFNRIELTELANTPITSVLRVSMVYTDAFLLLSGVLTAYNMAHEFITRGEIRWFCRFIARYIRLTPALLAVVFWYAFVMEHTGSGPQWNSIIIPNAELCKNNAWTNLLYIQNFFPFEEMCATHTHQLALDMQLSILAPMLVFFLECRPVIGLLVIFFFTLLSATLRYISTMNSYLSLVIFHGMSLKHLYRTANLVYALPLHRATPYVFGVGLGVLLRYTGRDVRIHKVLVILGWLIAMALGSWSLFSPWHLARRDYVYDAEEATNYAVISPVLWALALCWLIFACYTNHGGIINRFLSNYWLVIFSRISYAVYLTQFAVFFYNVGTTRYSSEFQLHRAIDPLEAATVIFISILLTLFFDIPMQEIKNVLMESTDILNVEVPSKEKSAVQPPVEPEKPYEAEKAHENEDFDDDELGSTGWDWQRDIVGVRDTKYTSETLEDEERIDIPIWNKSAVRRTSLIGRDSHEPEMIQPSWLKDPSRRLSKSGDEYRDRGRRSRSGQRDYQEPGNEAMNLSRMQQEREEAVKRGRRSLSRSLDSKRLSTRDSENEEEYARRRQREYEDEEEVEEEEDDPRRYRRSQSRGRSVIRESDDYRSWEFVGKERSSSRGPDSKRLSRKSEERESAQRQTRPPLSRSSDVRKTISSESDDEHSSQRRKIEKRHPSVEPRISDEEDWESELRIRRKQFMEKLATHQQESLADEEDVNSLRRRSSAEGKIALLKDLTADDNMDSWTVSVGSRVAQLGSSQERSETEEDAAAARRREYREQAPPPREDTQSEEEVIWDSSRRRSYTSSSQVTSIEEDDDVASYDFVLTKDSKRISVQDLSKLSQDDSDLTDSGWNVVKKDSGEELLRSSSTGLYKRESIIKSQASEEDPEYLLPERPKLVQQEREHPFKKAWQMQKSRSEEDGSGAYAIKETKEQPKTESKSKGDDISPEEVKKEFGGEQYEDTGAFADDESESITLARSRSTDTEENTRTSSKSEEVESTSTERSKSSETNKGNLKSSDVEEDSLRSNWPSEDEQLEVCKTGPRSKSEDRKRPNGPGKGKRLDGLGYHRSKKKDNKRKYNEVNYSRGSYYLD
ncbi:Nose resistant to fluoxetine protein 6 [Eufriesea mexicana]|uniref:Nose resistant to fluoxetine protein 6 n=1 Tax=Eufriesea mexicana TaxID=516756 RepID=A0A310SR65_9HYME|nr:Nose resistant to fluoxetine protein 6 [Eufriesea mexicana]